MSKQISLITNVCFEPYLRAYIKERFSSLSCEVQINIVLFEEYRDYIDNIGLADTIVVCLNFDEFYSNLSNDVLSEKVTYEAVETDCVNKCRELYTYLKAHSDANVIWLGFEDYYCHQNRNYGSVIAFEGLVDRLNLTLSDLLKEDTFVDFKRLIATVGLKNAYDYKGKYRWNAPYSKELIRLIADEIYKQHLIVTGNTKKCLVLDCDNVLWGGVLSEEGIEGIEIGNSGLGRPFHDFQQYLLELYYHGVILTVCSKNDESDVLRVFQDHTGMILKEEHIAFFKCNWNNKPDNIKDIADTLNIGLDSLVFVDDSIFEIESVKSMLPEVTTVLYHRDTVYDELSCFNLKQSIDLKTISERTSTYKTNLQRSELQKNALSYEDYISSLEMVIDIHRTTDYELARLSELTQRTNKCTNGVRYTLDQIKTLKGSENYELYTVCLSDKFSDLGIIGVMGINGLIIDLFSLSCRALGRKVEDKMISWLLERKIDYIRYIRTVKNDALRNIFVSYKIKIME